MTPYAAPPAARALVQLTIPKEPVWVSAARLAAAGVAHRAGLSIEGIDEVKIIVAEAISYCIHHGQQGTPLHLDFELATSELSILVHDPSFSVSRAESMRLPSPGPLGERGGLFIIESLADHVEYRMDPGHGLTLAITKNIEPLPC